MVSVTIKIGDKWARNISQGFQDWAGKTAKEGKSNFRTKFDPTPQIESAFYESGEAQLTELGKRLGVGVKFDLKSQAAIDWIKTYGAEEVKGIDAGTRAAIRQVVLKGQLEGLSLPKQSKEIQKIIGLLPQHVTVLENYKQSLGDIDSSVKDKMVERYAKRLLKYRADSIALTEGHTAANVGNIMATEDAMGRGILPEGEYHLTWLAASDERTCEDCESYDGTHAPIGGTFPNGLECPPAHPRCRCTTITSSK